MSNIIKKIDKYLTESGKTKKKLLKEEIVEDGFAADVIDLLNSLEDSTLSDVQLVLKDRLLSSLDGFYDVEINVDDVEDVEDVDELVPEIDDYNLDDLDDLDDLDYVGEDSKLSGSKKKKYIKEDNIDTIKKQIATLRAKKKRMLDNDYDIDSESELERIDKQIENLSKKLKK